MKSIIEMITEANASGADHVDGALDREELIVMLKDAFCEEMNAWYQYMIVKPFLVGPERKNIEELFETNAKDELEDHGYWLLERINALGGDCSAIDTPDTWNKMATHKYIIPESGFDVKKALKQNIDAERGAIETYTALEKFTRDKDVVTHTKIKEILADEEEHLQALLEYAEDIK